MELGDRFSLTILVVINTGMKIRGNTSVMIDRSCTIHFFKGGV